MNKNKLNTFTTREQQALIDYLKFDVNDFNVTDLIISNNLPGLNLVLSSIDVKAETRKLKVEWNPDLVEELTYLQSFEEAQKAEEERKRLKRLRYKDRRKYIKMIEEWCGVK